MKPVRLPQRSPSFRFKGVTVKNARPPKNAASPKVLQGVKWKCPNCGRTWPVWQSNSGKKGMNLTHSPECDEGGCRECRWIEVYDPLKEKPKLAPGEFAVEYQLKHMKIMEDELSATLGAKMGGALGLRPLGVTKFGRQAYSYGTLAELQIRYDGFELQDPCGRIVRDRDSFERVALALTSVYNTSKPRAYLKVIDHEGAHVKFEELARIFPPVEKVVHVKKEEVRGIPVDLKTSILRTLCKDASVERYADDGTYAVIVSSPEQLEAFEKRREQLRKKGSSFTATTLFHGTCAHNIPDILRLGLQPSALGHTALGPGIYLGLPAKAVMFAHTCSVRHFVPKKNDPHGLYNYTPLNRSIFGGAVAMPPRVMKQGLWYDVAPEEKLPCSLTRVERRRMKFLDRLHIALEVEVLLGNPYVIDGDKSVPNDEGPRRALGRGDSIYCTRFKQDEWCVFRRDQVLIKKVVILQEDPPRPKEDEEEA